ncbi:TPA: hypothetical protein L6B76_18420, partial [Pseudomonas aeruginosa]|nr:hypothetical protein [Pseudomonas aeruginosa]
SAGLLLRPRIGRDRSFPERSRWLVKLAAEADGGAPSTSSPGRLQSGWHSYCLRSPRTAHHRENPGSITTR